MMCQHFLGFILVYLYMLPADGFPFNISFNASDVRGELAHFWQSTGFCPPLPHSDAGTFNLSPDMQQNLAYISAVPFDGIAQVRIHWLFELVKVINITNGNPLYDFSKLDEFVELLHENELNFGFELMGNPSNLFTNFENQSQVYWWKDLVAQTAKRYIDKFGIEYVSKWNFETWNEPDCHDFDNLNMTVKGFLNYYDACSEGLRSVDKSLLFGGPGDDCVFPLGTLKSRYADALLNHTIHGINYFTGERGVRIDYVSFHGKGEGKGIIILQKETQIMQYIQSKYKELENYPYVNNEADPMVGWNRALLWRADVTYAAVATKVITQHQNNLKAIPNPAIKNYTLLSNDNGFLSYYPNQFTQRTLLARFQINNTDPKYVTFVRKPVYIIMTMLSLLGDKQIHVDTSVSNTTDFGTLASLHVPVGKNSSDSWQVSLLVYGASDPNTTTSFANLNINWSIDPPAGTKSLKMMMYGTSNLDTNPYQVWVTLFNKTDFPTLQQFAQIRKHEDPVFNMYDVPVKSGLIPIPPLLYLLDPNVIIMHLCAEPDRPPEKVTGLRFINVTIGQVLVVWSDRNIRTKCILTYEVELSISDPSGPYTRVNQQNSFITLFLFETDSEMKVQGYYRVRAVDYWNRGGDYSDSLQYSG